MNQRLGLRPVRLTWLCCSLLAVAWLAVLAGCQSDSAGSKWFTFKNPFTGSESAKAARETAPAYDAGKSADANQTEKQTPVVRTEPRSPEREGIAVAHDVKKAPGAGTVVRDGAKAPESNASVHESRSREASKPVSAAEYAQEMTRARNLERGGRFPEARAVYERLVTRYPDRYEAYHRLGVVADREKRYHEAQSLFGEAIRLNPGNADLHNDLGYCLYLQGRYAEAEAAVTHAIELNAANPRYYNNLGMIYGHQRRYDEALEQFRHGGSEADAYYNLAFMLAARDDAEGAKKYFHLALRADPGYDKARQALDVLDRAPEDRQEPSRNAARNQERHEGAQVSDRYDAQPASLVTSAVGNEQREATLIR